MPLAEKILASRALHTKLVGDIEKTEGSVAAYEKQDKHCVAIMNRLAASGNHIEHLEYKIQKEKTEHEEMRDANMKRLAYKIVGRGKAFDAKARKEERWVEFVPLIHLRALTAA
jgi:DNA-binding FrmR family transcriptional regulator